MAFLGSLNLYLVLFSLRPDCFLRNSQVDAELNKELEQWNETLKNEAVKLCQDNNFNTGFFEGSDNNCVIDAYEMKVIYASLRVSSQGVFL